MRTILASSALLVMLTASTIARSAEEERVTTQDGTVVQGELVESIPGKKLVLKLGNGDVRTFAWSELAAGITAPPKDADVVHLKDGGAVQGKLVEMVPNNHWTLKLATGEVRVIAWADAAPQRVPPLEPRLGGAPDETDLAPLPPTQTPAPNTSAPHTTLADVAAPHPSSTPRTMGMGLIIGGIVSALGGGGLVIGAYANPNQDIVRSKGVATTTSSPQSGLLIGGIVLGALGIIALGTGIPIFVTH